MLLVRSPFRPYTIAMVIVALALIVRALLDPILGPELPFYLFYFAITAASVSGGLGPGLAALSISFLSAVYFFVFPRYSLVLSDGETAFGAFRFITLGLMLAFGGGWANSLRTKWKLEVQARRKEAIEAHKVQEETLNALASIGDGLITVDTHGRIMFMNPIAEELSGWSAQVAKGRDVTEVFSIVHQHTRERVPDPIMRCLREERVVALPEDTLLITRNGVERPIDDSAAPIRDAHGRITGAVLVFREVVRKATTASPVFMVGEVELHPAPGSHLRLAKKELDHLEAACRVWIQREWRLDPNASRIVGLAGYNVTIRQDPTPPSGTSGVRFLAAYSR